MPDVFLDHFLYAGSIDGFVERLKSTASAGTRMRERQRLALGGNALNFGMNMARLGCHVELLARTDTVLLDMIRRESAGLSLGTGYVETGFEPSTTIAMEFTGSDEGTTLNINHPGSLGRFGFAGVPSSLLSKEFDMAAVFNMTNNDLGVELASGVFSSAKGLKLMDLPDSSSDFRDPEGLKQCLEMADIVSGNAAEVLRTSRQLGLYAGTQVRGAAVSISKLGLVVGVHSSAMCLESCDGRVESVRLRPLHLSSTTGAGDAWTAAFAYSILNKEKDAAKRLSYAAEYATGVLLKRQKSG